MMSKGMAFLIVLVTAGGTWVSLQIDRTRDVPYLPAQMQRILAGTAESASGKSAPAQSTRKSPHVAQAGAKASPKTPKATAKPAPGGVPEAFQVHIGDMELTPLPAGCAVVARDPGDRSFVKVEIHQDGGLTWGPLSAAGYDAIEYQFSANEKQSPHFLAVITPDRRAPWKYVYWAIQSARKAGANNVALGGAWSNDPKHQLLALMRTPLLPEGTKANVRDDVSETVVEVHRAADGKTTYAMPPQKFDTIDDLSAQIAHDQKDYAEYLGGGYDIDPSKTPWVISASPDVDAGDVLAVIAAMKKVGINSIRFGGKFPKPPADGK